MAQVLYIFASVFLVSAISLIGAVTLAIRKKMLQAMMSVFIAFASGTMLSAAFMHILPEAFHSVGEAASTLALVGILLFFFIEKFIHWHHCGKEECHIRPAAYLNLIGDGVHNFTDGVMIAAAYLTNTQIGIVTTAAIALHEIPQELGDFSVLIHSGMKPKKALLYNFISSLTAVAGAIAGYLFLPEVQAQIPYVLAAGAGGLIYIATADLMPELHKDLHTKKVFWQTAALLLGILILAAVEIH